MNIVFVLVYLKGVLVYYFKELVFMKNLKENCFSEGGFFKNVERLLKGLGLDRMLLL